MADQDTRMIPMSRSKQVFLAIACLGFVGLCLWLLTLDAEAIAQQRRFNSPALVQGVAILGIVLFGALGVFNIRKILDQRPGVVLSPEGLEDNSTGVAVGFIPWSDITGVDTYRTFNQRTLVVKVADPQKYLGGGNALARYLRKSNLKLCGSPVTITTAVLKIGYDDLMALIEEYLKRYGRAA